jgi:hypothetical protein
VLRSVSKYDDLQIYEMTRPDEPGSPPEEATITMKDTLTLLLLVAYIVYVIKTSVYKLRCIQVSSAS